jgi:hypothetical protein
MRTRQLATTALALSVEIISTKQENEMNDNSLYHVATCNCGHLILDSHIFEYRQQDMEVHQKICSKCEYREAQNHWYRAGLAGCVKCGYGGAS